MRTSDSKNHRCPNCNGRTAQDREGRGFVRHIEKITVNNKPCDYHLTLRDAKGRRDLEDVVNDLQVRVAKLEQQRAA
jgi:hypothetical protein